MKTTQLKTETLSSQAYDAIKDLIYRNELLPGQSIAIKNMAITLGISATPIREAFARLTIEGFLEGEPHKKVHVAKITEDDIHQVYRVRKLLEPQAAYLAAKVVSTDSHLKNLLKGLQKSAEKICTPSEGRINKNSYLTIHKRLHEALLSAVDPFFREILEFVGIRSSWIRTFTESVSRSRADELNISITKEHLQIIQALLDENADEAKSLVYKHIENMEVRTLQAVKTVVVP